MRSVFLPGRRGIAALRMAAFVGLICVGAAACGAQQGQSGSGPRAAGSSQPSTSAGGGHGTGSSEVACSAAQLDVTLDLKSAGVAAGTSVIPLDFTNVSTHGCRLAGYAFVTFTTSSKGRQVGAPSTADRAVTAKSLQLSAGKTAHLWLRMIQAANLPAVQCKPKTVAGLRVRLPGQASAIFIAHRFRTCAKRVHGADILTVEPFQAGRAHSGTAQ